MKTQSYQFLISSDDCELLLEFERTPSLQELCQRMARDHSVVSRALKRISEKFEVVEKKAGKWVLTDLGRRVNESTRLALANQVMTLNQQSTFRLGANREFASRVLAPDYKNLVNIFLGSPLSIQTYEQGVEAGLLQGQIDFGFDCGRPYSPEIAYKLVIDEPIIAVASQEFIKMHKKEISAGHYMSLPHLLCERLHPDKIFLQNDNQLLIKGRFNDIATTREVCIQGVGWALLPAYTVKQELEEGRLQKFDENFFGKSQYGIWWLRNRSNLELNCEKLIHWLKTKKLS